MISDQFPAREKLTSLTADTEFTIPTIATRQQSITTHECLLFSRRRAPIDVPSRIPYSERRVRQSPPRIPRQG